jgi:hypothetical protein
MPLYTYTCENQHCNQFNHMCEAVVPFEERDMQVCELCKRLLHRASIERTGAPKWRCKIDTASAGKAVEEST